MTDIFALRLHCVLAPLRQFFDSDEEGEREEDRAQAQAGAQAQAVRKYLNERLQ